MLKDRRWGEGGQVFLIVLMVTVIALTIGLSVASRSIVSLRTSREERDSQRALAAAEAGIEQVLKTGNTRTGLLTGASYTATPTNVSGTEVLVHGGNVIPKDEGGDIWLVPHHSNNDPDFSTPWSGNLTIYWGLASDVCHADRAINTMAAIEIAVVSGTVSLPIVKRSTYDPCAARRNSNNFSGGLGGPLTFSGKEFLFSTPSIPVVSGFFVRAIPLYAGSTIGVTANTALPSQGTIIDATGESFGTSRKIKVFKGYPSLPSQFFVYGLFSP